MAVRRDPIEELEKRAMVKPAVNWFAKLHPTVQALIVLGATFGAGTAFATLLGRYRGVPRQVAENTEAIDSIFRHERVIWRIQGLEAEEISQNNDIRHIRVALDSIKLSSCLTLAELRQEGWSRCTGGTELP